MPSDPHLDLPSDLTDVSAVMVNGDGFARPETTNAGIREVAARGAAWTVAGYAARQVFRFGFNLLLTRLVAPEVFGIMAIINVLIQSLHMFSDLGISQCVIHHERGDDPPFLNTAWTLQVFRGLGLWLLAGLFAWPAAWFYEQPALAWLIPLAAITAALDGFYSTSVFTLNRRMIRSRLVLLELVPYLIVMSVATVAIFGVARLHPGGADDPAVQDTQVLVLVIGQVAIVGIQVIASYWLLRGRHHHFTLDPRAARELIHFGGWIFICTAAGFLAMQADQLVIGKKSFETLGVYRVASQLAAMPAQFVAALCAQLVFPLYSRLFRDGASTETGVAGIHRTLGVLAGWLVTGLIVAGPTFIECLYRGKYQDASAYVQILAGAAWFTMLQSTGEAVLLARGQSKLMALAQVLKLIALAPLMYYGYHWHGVIGLVVGYGIAEVLRYIVIALAVRTLGQSLAWGDLGLTLLVAMTAGGLMLLGPTLWGHAGPWTRLVAEALAVTAVWGIIFLVLQRGGRVGLG
jgi:O-antigen/teichoic acid export membrane protein